MDQSMEEDKISAEEEPLSQLNEDATRMRSDLDELPPASEKEIAESRELLEKIKEKILSFQIESFKPSLVRQNDPAKSYLGYPYKILEVLKEEGVDQIRARTLIHHLPELKLFKLPLPSVAQDLSSQCYLPASIVQEFVKGSKLKAIKENKNQKHAFLKGKRALDRLILIPEIVLFERAKHFCEDEKNKATFQNQVYYPSDLTVEGDAKLDTFQGRSLQDLGVQAVHKLASWFNSELKAVQVHVALLTNIILLALDCPIKKDLFADRSNIMKLKKTINQSDISVRSVYSSESPASIQSRRSSLKNFEIESGHKMKSVQQHQSPQNQDFLSVNLGEVKYMLEKKITKSRLQQLLEEMGSIRTIEAKVRETFVEKARQKHLESINRKESDLESQLKEVREKRKEEEIRVLDDDPEVKEFTASLKKVKKIQEEGSFDRLCKLMEDSQYEKLTARIESNQTITHDLENQINKLSQELQRVNADTTEATVLFSSTEFYQYLNIIEKSRQCYVCLQSEGYILLVYSEDCPHRLCDKCADIQLDQVENKNYDVSLVGYKYRCLLCLDNEGSTIQRKIFGVVKKN